jgi:L-lactate dehydrogenase complex protein LldG
MTGSEDRRRQMLDRIRSALDDGTPQHVREARVRERLGGASPHLVPERARGGAAEMRAIFTEHLAAQSATVVSVASAAEVPVAVAGYLRGNNLPMRLRLGGDARLSALPWSREPALTLERGAARADDEVALSHAASAVAETGTLILASGPDNPVTLNFLPDTHIVVVDAQSLKGHYEAALEAARQHMGATGLPRTLNFISGPSRSAEIGGKPVLGAHGPRRLCVIIVG